LDVPSVRIRQRSHVSLEIVLRLHGIQMVPVQGHAAALDGAYLSDEPSREDFVPLALTARRITLPRR
jgi:hypothetical protein